MFKTNKQQGYNVQHRKYNLYFLINLKGVQTINLLYHDDGHLILIF